jgi:hypothetical protein
MLRPGPLSVDAQVSIPDLTEFNWLFPDYIPSDGDLQAKLQMAGTWQAPSGTFIFKSRGLNDPPNLKSMPPGPIDIDGNIQLAGQKLMVESIQINSPRLTFASRGEWTGMPALTELLQGEAAKPSGNVDMTRQTQCRRFKLAGGGESESAAGCRPARSGCDHERSDIRPRDGCRCSSDRWRIAAGYGCAFPAGVESECRWLPRPAHGCRRLRENWAAPLSRSRGP